MHRAITVATWSLGLLAASLTAAQQAAAQQAADHPLVGRFEAAEIVDYHQTDFDEYTLLTQKVTGGVDWGDAGKANFGSTLEGKLIRITYEAPDQHTSLEVMRAYQDALAANAFEVLFQCANAECGGRDFNHAVVPYGITFSENYKDQRYLAARKSRPEEGDVHVAVYTVKAYAVGGERHNRVYTQVDVVEAAPRSTRVVVVEAEEMAERIDSDGRVALYGIHFDTDSATVRPDSEPTLEQIAALLANDPALKLLVVGHTDDQGAFEYNVDLSKRRAAAVIDVLAADHGVSRDRLRPWGVGYAAPVATNATPDGRARNRRVELVPQ